MGCTGGAQEEEAFTMAAHDTLRKTFQDHPRTEEVAAIFIEPIKAKAAT